MIPLVKAQRAAMRLLSFRDLCKNSEITNIEIGNCAFAGRLLNNVFQAAYTLYKVKICKKAEFKEINERIELIF